MYRLALLLIFLSFALAAGRADPPAADEMFGDDDQRGLAHLHEVIRFRDRVISSAIEYLRDHGNDDDRAYNGPKHRAVQLIVEFHAEEAIPTLIGLLSWSRQIKAGERVTQDSPLAFPAVIALQEIGPPVVPHLLGRLRFREDLGERERTNILWLLNRIVIGRTTGAIDHLTQIANRIESNREWMDAPHFAIGVLQDWRAPEAVEILSRHVATHIDRETAPEGISSDDLFVPAIALAEIGGPEVLRAARRGILDADSRRELQTWVWILSEVDGGETHATAARLSAYAESATDDDQRRNVTDAVALLRDGPSLPSIEE